jgi:peptide/nickel transport system substrate-binding protein
MTEHVVVHITANEFRQVPGIALLLLTLAVGVLLAGCEGVPAHQKPWRRPPPDPPLRAGVPGSAAARALEASERAQARAHTLRVHLEAEPSHLHPLLDPDLEAVRITGPGGPGNGPIFESLVTLAPEPGAAAEAPWIVVPQLAERWRVSGDGRELRFTLREGVRFHDGGRMSVVDVQFSLDHARTRSPRLREALASVMTVEIAGTRELRVTLRREDAYVLRALAETPILPVAVYGPGGPSWQGAKRTAIGTGPFKLGRWDRGERVILVRNDTYWGPRPGVDAVELVIEPDLGRALMRAKHDEIDVLPRLAWAHVPDQVTAMAGSFAPLDLQPARLRYLVVNSSRPPFDDARVREAVALLIDRRRLTEEIWHGTVRAAAGPIWPGGPAHAPAMAVPQLDATTAARLLDEAGWLADAKDGSRHRAGERLRVVMLTGNDAAGDRERELVVSCLRRAGFQVELRAGDPAVLVGRLKEGAFDLATLDWRARPDENLAPLLGTGGARNFGRYSSKAMDAALAEAQAAWQPGARLVALAHVAQVLGSDWPIIGLYAPAPVGLVHRRVRGLAVHDGWFSLAAVTLAP